MSRKRPTAPGFLITFEGVEGSGKSTQAELLARRLREGGRSVLLSREPGGPALAESIRRCLLDPAGGDVNPLAELYLYLAARAQHVEETLRPALGRGEVVVVDRFADATLAYQGGGRGLPRDLVEGLAAPAAGGLVPDLTFLLDIPPEEGLARVEGLGRERDRLESEELPFHERVRDFYLEIARREPKRMVVVDGRDTPTVLEERIGREAERRLMKLTPRG